MGSNEQMLKSYLSNCKYKYADIAKKDILGVFSQYKDLRPTHGPFIFKDDSQKDLVNLDGTIPVNYRGNIYNIPIGIFILDTHPYNPPICYVKPTNTMQIKQGTNVDANGKVDLPYLRDWRYPQSDLLGLIQILVIVFSEEPPVFSRSANSQNRPPPYQGGAQQPPYPAQGGFPMPQPYSFGYPQQGGQSGGQAGSYPNSGFQGYPSYPNQQQAPGGYGNNSGFGGYPGQQQPQGFLSSTPGYPAGYPAVSTGYPYSGSVQTESKNLKKIISLFVEPNMNLKPKDVAQKSGLGKSRKSVNKLLYHLEKKKVLTVTTSDGKDPKWNKNPVAQYSDRDLHEWAAELEYGITRLPAPTGVVSHHHHHNYQHEQNTNLQVGDQNVMDDMVPTEIKLMADKRSVPLYLKLLESGSEKKRDIRLVVVGKKGAGKTSLIKRLFSEEKTDVTSTNGIEIHTIKCKAMIDDGIWNKLDGSNEETEIHARLLKQYKGTLKASVEELEGAHETVNENPLITVLYKRIEEAKESETVTQQPKKRELQVTTESLVEPPVTSQQQNQALEQAKMDIENMLKSNVDLDDKEEYATLFLWDFAGDEEFYHTHQTFLSSSSIYLVVTKLNDADDKKAQDLFQLWMDSIHCYSRLEEDKSNSADSQTSDDLDPPVVIVGTWKDAVASNVEEIDDACRENMFKFTENMSEDEFRHIRQEYFISNTEDDPSVFQHIRENILNLARKMKTWNKVYPLKFIQLEKRLQEKKKELPIISFDAIQHISTDTPNPLNDEELRLFLEFHHEIRALVYFKDLPSYIILDTQWLSDAFRCIVTAQKFRAISTRNRKKWDELYSRGILHSEVLDDIFKKSENIFSKHKDHILNVMEKFDIIIRPNTCNISENQRDAGDDKPLYYVPCMIKSEPKCDIYEMFNVTENTCNKSTWLCYMFKFLPPHLINHLIASLCREYKVAEVVTKEQKRQIALFGGSAVFELQKRTKLAKLYIMKCPNWIQIQVWQFGKGYEGGMYKYIDEFVTEEIVKIISTRFKMSNVNFWKKLECGLTKPESVTGSNDFSEELITDYYCESCTCTHIFIGEWQDLKRRISCVSEIFIYETLIEGEIYID